MKNLQELAKEKAFEKFPNRFKEDIQYDFNAEAREGFIEGFLAHAQLAVEDKKELLEALKSIIDSVSGDDYNERKKAYISAKELIRKHETI